MICVEDHSWSLSPSCLNKGDENRKWLWKTKWEGLLRIKIGLSYMCKLKACTKGNWNRLSSSLRWDRGLTKVAVLKNGTSRTFHAGRSKTVLHRQELRKKVKEIGWENAESSFPPVKPGPLLGSDWWYSRPGPSNYLKYLPGRELMLLLDF